jgi:nitric-oxide synthase
MLARPAESRLAARYAEDRPSMHHAVDPAEAEAFVRRVHAELPTLDPVADRLAEVRREIARSGTYRHTATELEHGGERLGATPRAASAGCTGGVSWCGTHGT